MLPGPPPDPTRSAPAVPAIPEGVELIQRELDVLVKEITAGIKRTAGDVTEADRLTDINERLVAFVTDVIQAVSKLLEYIETYNAKVADLTKQLNEFGVQLQKKGTGAQVDRASTEAVKKINDMRNMVKKALDNIKKYMNPVDEVVVQNALKNWENLTSSSSKLARPIA